MHMLYLQKKPVFIVLLLFIAIYVYANEIAFPPEFSWWIQEIKKANPSIEVNAFKFLSNSTKTFNENPEYIKTFHKDELTYPIFTRWNYSGNTIGYYNYNAMELRRRLSGKYSIVGGGEELSFLYIADKNKNIFFHDFFGVTEGLNAISWLTDTILIGVGFVVNSDNATGLSTIDLYIIYYKIDHVKKTVEKAVYTYENAFKNSDRDFLKLNWFEHRSDYFELRQR